MWTWVAFAVAGVLNDATALYPFGTYTCAERASGPDVCWSDSRAARPLSEIDELATHLAGRVDPVQVVQLYDGWCVLERSGQVYCRGEQWRFRAGLAPHVPSDEWVEVEELRGATELAGRCGRVDDTVRCPSADALLTLELPPVQALFPPHCAKTTRGVHCWYPPRLTAREALNAARDASLPHADGASGLFREADGTVREWTSGGASVKVGVPALQTGLRSLATVGERRCALVPNGQVQCWGDNARDSVATGVALFWRPAPRVPDEPAPCVLDQRRVRCRDGWPVEAGSHAVHRYDGVDELRVAGTRACIRAGRSWRCFGTNDGYHLSPETVFDGVVDVSVGPQLALLRADGQVLAFDDGRWTERFRQPGEQVVSDDERLCVRSGERLVCASDEGSSVVTGVAQMQERGGKLCTGGRCLDRVSPTRSSPYTVRLP